MADENDQATDDSPPEGAAKRRYCPTCGEVTSGLRATATERRVFTHEDGSDCGEAYHHFVCPTEGCPVEWDELDSELSTSHELLTVGHRQ